MNVLTRSASCPPLSGPAGDTSDALSAPTGAALLRSLLSYLPRGSAWRTDYVADLSDSSYLHRFWRAVAEPVADLYAKAWELAMQSTACTVSTGLADWQIEFGLPDPCATANYSEQTQLTLLRAKVAAEGGGRPADLICQAAALGYQVAIEEPRWFEFGRSAFELGNFDWSRFEFGYSAFGDAFVEINGTPVQPVYFEFGYSAFGDRFSDYQGDAAQRTDQLAGNVMVKRFEFGWSAFGRDWGSRFTDFPVEMPVWAIVHVANAEATYFEFGVSAFGDPFSDFLAATDLECTLRRNAPAHVIPIFDYANDLPPLGMTADSTLLTADTTLVTADASPL
jgi:uncharacterized protein YmfQ (DUF2313 family)